MKIAILSCFHPYRGGISQFNTTLFTELSKEHTVKAFNFKRQYPEILFPGKTQYVEQSGEKPQFDTIRILDTANPLTYLPTARSIREFGPDMLIMRYWMPYFAPSLGFVARHIGKECKIISIMDNVIPHEQHFFDKPLTRYFMRANNGFVTLCNAVKEDLLDIDPKAKYCVCPHPVYSNFGERTDILMARQALGIDPAKKTLLFFGLIRDYKGLDILIEAFAGLDSSYQLVIAGEPYGSIDKYAQLIQKSGRKEDIHLFDRFIADDEVSKFFCASDLCVLPYRSATQSGISAIAYHFDLPMVTTAVGGLPEAIGATGTGIVTEDITPEGIRKAITNYFSDPSTPQKMKKAIAAEKERLSWSTFCKNIINFYNTL